MGEVTAMHHRTLHRALLLGALAAGAWTATELADDHAAHADAKPAVTIDRPAVLDRAAKLPPRLPQQASARGKAAVAKATRPSAPAEPQPEPTTEPKPAPSDEPTPPADEPPVELPPVEVPLPTPTPTEPLPTPVELPPVEVPPMPAPPVEVPTPAPPADPAVVVPGALPAVVDPIPAPPPAGTVVTQLIAGLTAGTGQPADCADSLDARRIDRDALRHLLAGLDRKPAPTTAQKPAPGCPGTPDRGTPGGVQVKPPPPSAADMVVAYLARSHVAPVLARLEHTRARSHLPASRHVAMEPGPA